MLSWIAALILMIGWVRSGFENNAMLIASGLFMIAGSIRDMDGK